MGEVLRVHCGIEYSGNSSAKINSRQTLCDCFNCPIHHLLNNKLSCIVTIQYFFNVSQLNKYLLYLYSSLQFKCFCLKMNFTNYFNSTATLKLCQIFLALCPLFHHSFLRIIYLSLPIKSGSHHEQTSWAVYTL